MQAAHTIDFLYSISGFFVGMLVGMTGVGGGSLMTPILILLFGVHPATAVGTDLLYASVTKTGGTLVHGFNHTVDWRVVGRLAAGSVPMTALTLFVLSKFDLSAAGVQTAITTMLSIALFVTALTLIFRRRILSLYGSRVGELDPRRTRQATVAMGALLGVLVSISSVGAGAIGVTGLILLYPRMSTARIVGSDIAHAVPLTFVAGVGHWIMGSIDTHLLGSLLLGSVPGILLGSYVAGRVPDPVLRALLAAALIIVAGKLVM
ncbi:MAG TPA: sulfite exporter TauE/SafE family protein [Stellaceae bacterium]|nr:sulfite exporter TauE/SafE family protein [Stellaceae bacterium]